MTPSSSGLTGRSSIPETSEAWSRSLWDTGCPACAGHDHQRNLRHYCDGRRTRIHIPATHDARALHLAFALSKIEGAGKAGWPHAPGACAQKELREARRPQVQAVTTGLPRAMVLRLIRTLVSAKSARMCERAVLTNRPSLDLSPYVLKGRKSLTGS